MNGNVQNVILNSQLMKLNLNAQGVDTKLKVARKVMTSAAC